MEEPSNTIVETREEFMVSSIDQTKAFLRTAHFIKPLADSIKLPNLPLPRRQLPLDSRKSGLKVSFSGWTSPGEKWSQWVDKMALIHRHAWKSSGIYEGIMSSKCRIIRDNELVYKLAEKWCPETSSFVFQWGEVTITLEDMVAFGFSALGSPVFSPLETQELKAIEEGLEKVRVKLTKTAAMKAAICPWIREFMGKERDIEHAAFLSLWLSRYVLDSVTDRVRKHVFPAAIRLARGTRVALGPAVLASIYRDLRLLRSRIVELANSENDDMDYDVSALGIKSPFHLVQVWAWERFAELSPRPHLLNNGEPRLARWDKLRQKTEKVNLVMDLAKATFKWRPYVEIIENWELPMIYRDKSAWVGICSGIGEEFLLFAKCLRVSSLNGVQCTENYYPHRVAMQFGFDQDVPDLDENDEISGKHYDRPVDVLKLYVPSRSTKGHITTRYLGWWKQQMSELQDSIVNSVYQKRSLVPIRTGPVVRNLQTSNRKCVSNCLKTKPKISKAVSGRENLKRLKAAAKSYSTSAPPRNGEVDMTVKELLELAIIKCSVGTGGNKDTSSPMPHNSAHTSSRSSKASAAKIREGVEVIIIEDEDEAYKQVFPSESNKKKKGAAQDNHVNQPSAAIDKCAVRNTMGVTRPNDKKGKAKNPAPDGVTSHSAGQKNYGDPQTSELEVRLTQIEKILEELSPMSLRKI